LWIVSHRPEWGDRLAQQFYGDLITETLPRPDPVETAAQLAQLAKSPAIQETVASIAGNHNVPLDARLIALRAMAAAGLTDTPKRWLEVVTDVLAHSEGPVAHQAVATARTLTLPKQGTAPFFAALAAVGRDRDIPAEVRLDALAATSSLAAVEPVLFDFLTTHLAGTQPMLVRSAAAQVLARAQLTAEQQLALADTMQRLGPLETPKLLPVFEKSPTEALGLKLVASLKQSAGLAGLRVDLLKPLFAKYPPAVQQQGEAVLTLLNADAAKQTAHLEELLATCKNGDIRRGQVIFNSAKAACATCHAMGYLGGRLGPDLTRIGQARNERDLLEAIVYPSASFVRSYEPFTVTTKGGEDYSGIVRKDAPDELVLATGPEIEQRVARSEVKELRPGAVSLMPAGLDTVLTKQELADLLAFLKATQ
jgi:putative heme-binding domain-containing protein